MFGGALAEDVRLHGGDVGAHPAGAGLPEAHGSVLLKGGPQALGVQPRHVQLWLRDPDR